MHVKKSTRKPPIGECCLPDCRAEVRSAGRCGIHYQELRREHPEEIERLKGLSSDERDHEYYKLKHRLPRPRWTYEGNEDELIRVYGRASNRHVKVGCRTTAPQIEQENSNG